MNKLEKGWIPQYLRSKAANMTPREFKGKHPDWYWVTVEIPLTKKEMLKAFGPNCHTFLKGCACCEAWRSWAKIGRAKVIMERKNCLLPDVPVKPRARRLRNHDA